MKGPGLRWDLDTRRVWRCATCGTERHVRGTVTSVTCHFCQDHPLMSLIEMQRPARGPSAPLDPVIELHPDDVDAPAFVPVHLRDPEDVPAEDAERSEDPVREESVETNAPAKIDEKPAGEKPSNANDSPLSAEPPSSEKPDRPSKNRRTKNRRKRKRRSSTTESSASTETPGPSAQNGTSPSGDDDFGAGLDS